MNENLSCEQIKELISLYLDKEITKEEESIMNEHLQTCKDCLRYYESMVLFSRRVKKINHTPEVDIASTVIEKLNDIDTCRRVSDNLSAYIDRELLKEEMIEISEHLLSCKYCRKDYENLKQTCGLVKNYFKNLNIASPLNSSLIVKKAIRKQRIGFIKASFASVLAIGLCSWLSIARIEPVIKESIRAKEVKNQPVFVKAEDYMLAGNFFEPSEGANAFVYEKY